MALSVSVPLAFPRPRHLASSCLPLFSSPSDFPISVAPGPAGCFSCHSARVSSLCLCQYLFLSLPLSHLNTLRPLLPLCHASLLSPSLVHLVAPLITSGHNRERLCLGPCSIPPPSLRLSAVDGDQVQSKLCSLPKNNNELRNHRGTRQSISVFQETSRSLGTK